MDRHVLSRKRGRDGAFQASPGGFDACNPVLSSPRNWVSSHPVEIRNAPVRCCGRRISRFLSSIARPKTASTLHWPETTDIAVATVFTLVPPQARPTGGGDTSSLETSTRDRISQSQTPMQPKLLVKGMQMLRLGLLRRNWRPAHAETKLVLGLDILQR